MTAIGKDLALDLVGEMFQSHCRAARIRKTESGKGKRRRQQAKEGKRLADAENDRGCRVNQHGSGADALAQTGQIGILPAQHRPLDRMPGHPRQ